MVIFKILFVYFRPARKTYTGILDIIWQRYKFL